MKIVGLIAASLMASLALPVLAQTQAHQMQPPMDYGMRGGPDGGRGGPGGHDGPPSPERMFAEMDANHDGGVSKAEFMAFHARHRDHRPGPPPGPPPVQRPR